MILNHQAFYEESKTKQIKTMSQLLKIGDIQCTKHDDEKDFEYRTRYETIYVKWLKLVSATYALN